MPSEKVAVALRGAKALNDRDLHAMLEIAHPEIEWGTHPGFPGQEPVYRGHDGVRRWLDQALEPWATFEVEVEESLDAPEDEVVVVSRVRARGIESGVEVDMRTYDVLTVEDGKIRRRRSYSARDDALRAAKLSS
jgi:ketosteroid isomerase-like protein